MKVLTITPYLNLEDHALYETMISFIMASYNKRYKNLLCKEFHIMNNKHNIINFMKKIRFC